MRQCLGKDERNFLYYKYTKQGLTPEEANDKIDNLNKDIIKLNTKIGNEKLTPKEKNLKFKEEFAKLIGQW